MTVLASTRALLQGAVDYAGTFPPAGLSLKDAAATYTRARHSGDAWLLGRMVVHESHLDDLLAALPVSTGLKASVTPADAGDGTHELTVVLGAGVEPDATRLARYNERWGGRARIMSVELAPTAVEEIRRIADRLGHSFEAFFETPLDDTLDSRLDAIASAGACAKVRTGGTTAPAIPAPQGLARFLRGCADRRLCFKATAGLHHAIRSCYSLTYERDSATAVMHGFLNVSIAATLARQAVSVGDLTDALSEPSAAVFEFREDGVDYRGSLVPLAQIIATRRLAFRSFGSCSFREPVDELARLQLV